MINRCVTRSRTARGELGNVRKWALIDLQLAKLAEEMVSLQDQWNQPLTDSCCIVNPQVQSMLQTIFAEVRQIGVDENVLDISDIFPNSTGSRYPARKAVKKPQPATIAEHLLLQALPKSA